LSGGSATLSAGVAGDALSACDLAAGVEIAEGDAPSAAPGSREAARGGP
jgi:hypothetical protein